jgi:hypothetical protein
MITMCISTLSFYSLDLFQHIEMILFIHWMYNSNTNHNLNEIVPQSLNMSQSYLECWNYCYCFLLKCLISVSYYYRPVALSVVYPVFALPGNYERNTRHARHSFLLEVCFDDTTGVEIGGCWLAGTFHEWWYLPYLPGRSGILLMCID